MPATIATQARGAAYRARITELLLAAGPAGMSTQELAADLGITPKMAAYYLRESQIAVRPGKSCQRAGWWHPEFAEHAQIKQRTLPAGRMRFSAARISQVQRLLKEAGVTGISMRAVADALGVQRNLAGLIVKHMQAEKLLQRGRLVVGQGRVEAVLLAPGYVLPESPRNLRKRERARIARANQPKPPKERFICRPGTSVAKQPPKPSWRDLPADVSRARITVCPGFVSNSRYEVERVEPMFSAMQVGAYLSSGSAVERAYGETV